MRAARRSICPTNPAAVASLLLRLRLQERRAIAQQAQQRLAQALRDADHTA